MAHAMMSIYTYTYVYTYVPMIIESNLQRNSYSKARTALLRCAPYRCTYVY